MNYQPTPQEWQAFANSLGYELAEPVAPIDPRVQELLDQIDAELQQWDCHDLLAINAAESVAFNDWVDSVLDSAHA